ncbi:MAG: hypothetical protein AAF371_12080 [Pseudomonadota bacterium]
MDKDRSSIIEASANRQITVAITNSSAESLTIANFQLAAGAWETAPELGGTVAPGNTPSYVNFTDQPFTNLGGSIALVPAQGGTLDITWKWDYGSAVSGKATVSNAPAISVSSNVINANTLSPTLQVRVTNASS